MSRHEGVSCDSCMKSNFRGRRYKCLICYDYDLCATCYEAGATTTRHTVDHAMQCILTRSDFDLYYGGEALTSEQPQAFTCPYCSKMGFTETTLQEHVTSEHPDSALEVVCPVCAALPGGDANHVTDDFAAHMTLEHRAPREFQDEPIGGIRHVRRIPHPGRGMGGPRARRSNMHFQSAGSTLSGLSPSSRENTMDPIAELLSQLSNVRSRAAAAQNVSSQLQQLEMQLQSTRLDDRLEFASLPLGFHRHTIARQQLEKLPRRQAEGIGGSKVSGSSSAQQPTTVIDLPSVCASSASSNSQFLLARFGESELSETERATGETERADRSLFVQELLLSTLAEGLRLDDSLPDTSSLASLYLSSIDQPQDSSPSPQPPVGGGGGGSESGGGGSEPQNPPSGGAPASSANPTGGEGGSTGGGGASAGAGVVSGLTNASSTTEAPATYPTTPGGAAATNLPHGGEKKREKTSNSHRNMVKRLEAKKLEKEPPPSMLKAKKSQH